MINQYGQCLDIMLVTKVKNIIVLGGFGMAKARIFLVLFFIDFEQVTVQK